jgi:hypothetical protein
METKNAKRGVRPVVVALLLACLAGAVAIPLWLLRHRAPLAPIPDASEPVAQAPPPIPMVTPLTSPPPRVRAKRSRPLPAAKPAPPAPPPSLEDRWGIQVCSLRLSAANSIVDLRYRVTDPVKANQLADGKTPAYLVDTETGAKLIMPTPPKEGAFPPTGNRLTAGKTYFAMVSNQRGALRSGSVVNVLVGTSLVTNLTVE